MSTPTKFAAFAATAMLVSVLALSSTASFAAGDVVATVNGDKILKADVTKILTEGKIPADKQAEVFPMAVNQIINEKLVDMAATSSKVAESADFKKRIDIIHAQLVKQIYLEDQIKDKISEKAIKAEYAKFKKENEGQMEIHARHILVPTEEEAKQVIKDLDSGAKFEDLAKKRSSGPTADGGGDLSWFIKTEMVKEFSDAAFEVKPGAYTKTPVKTQFGWHVINVLEKRERKIPELAAVEGPITQKLGQEAMAELINGLRAKADIALFDDKGNKIEPKKN